MNELLGIVLAAAFTGGLDGLVKIMQPSVMSNDGLLCYIIPGLSNRPP